MKRFVSLALLGVTLATASAQVTTVDVSLNPSYTDNVYVDLSANTDENYTAADWDLAFLRIDNMNMGIRVNEGAGISVYEASNDLNDWSSIGVNTANFTQVHNSDTSWGIGALDNGSATYGWGEYNPDNHHVTGSVIFVLEYPDGSFKKLKIDDYFGAYTFTYATWNATNSAWENETTETVANTNNPNHFFNYFSLQNNTQVTAAPTTENWDFVFTKYVTDVQGMMYPVTGVLQNPNVTVAQNEEPNAPADPNTLSYASEINTIGYDWKSFNGSGYSLNPDTYYYVKDQDNSVFRIHFTDFEGSATGNVSFEYEDVSAMMSTTQFNKETAFSIYPNPTTNRQITLLYENAAPSTQPTVKIYNLTGAMVFQTELQTSGFYNRQIDLSNLSSGTYLVQYNDGQFTKTTKLILQ